MVAVCEYIMLVTISAKNIIVAALVHPGSRRFVILCSPPWRIKKALLAAEIKPIDVNVDESFKVRP